MPTLNKSDIKITTKYTHDYHYDRYHGWTARVKSQDFSILICPDTSFTLLGQKRQALKIGRAIQSVLGAAGTTPREVPGRFDRDFYPDNNMYEWFATGPSPDYHSYVKKSRKKNRPGYITDSRGHIEIRYRYNWQDASDKTWWMARLITDALRKTNI